MYCVLIFASILSACRNKESKDVLPVAEDVSGQTKDLPQTYSVQEWIKLTLEPLMKDSASAIPTEAEPLLFAAAPIFDLYSKNNFEPVWINETGLNKNGEEFLKILSNTEQYGLLKNYYGVTNITDALKAVQNKEEQPELLDDIELSMTNAWFLLALHLHEGAVGSGQLLNKNFGNNIDFYVKTLLKSIESNKITSTLEELQPQDFQYKNLQTALREIAGSKNKIPKGFTIPDHKSDSVACAQKVWQALVYQGYLDTIQTSSAQYHEKLKKFQKDHGLEADGVPGPNTRALLLLDNTEKYNRIAMNLDRWRSQKYKFPKEYVFVNIPAFELYWIKDNTVLHKHRVVVGKPNTKTPDIISDINIVVLNPDWTVPQSIIRGELRHKSAGYLSRYNIFQNGAKVSPGGVNWSSGNIRVVQPPGPANALGFVKFLFQNSHSVYLHDTPSRSLFANSVRAYSHGCVRVQNPLDFGLELLKRDGRETMNMDSVQSIIHTGKTTNISLKNKMPIYIQYYTTAAIEEGNPEFYPDLYKREDAQASVLFYGRYDKSVDPNKARRAVPSIVARPEAIELPADSLSLQATP